MKVMVNNTDITKYIQESSYDINSSDVYKSWTDGNFVEHRIYTRKRVSGSFQLALYGQDNMTTQSFLNLWNGAVSNNVVTIMVYVSNLGKNEIIEAYFSMNVGSHKHVSGNRYVDLIDITLEER